MLTFKFSHTKSEGLKVKNKLHNIKVMFEIIYNFMKKIRLDNIQIHTNFDQNWSINECAKKILAF